MMFDELDYVIDLETMGTTPGCAIMSIGACSVLESETLSVVISDPFSAGLTVSADTLRWWLAQSAEARKALTSPDVNLKEALNLLSVFLPRSARVWSFGAGFDLPILRYAYGAVGLEVPWNHRNERCCRTLFSLASGVDRPERTGTYHDSLADAQHQAEWMRKIAEELGI